MECIYQQGELLMNEGDYEGALVFSIKCLNCKRPRTPAGNAPLQPALAALESRNSQEALELFLTIPGYKDADDYVHQLRYAAAIDAVNARDYAGAIEQLELLGNYKNSAEELENAKYGYAVALLEQGQYEEAITRLAALGNYQNSAGICAPGPVSAGAEPAGRGRSVRGHDHPGNHSRLSGRANPVSGLRV